MATIPKQVTLTNSSVDILNAIRNSATINYREYVPIATKDADSIREIGAIIMDYPNLQNEFLSALVNRIGRVIIKSKMYSNPWAVFKKGILEFGETVEEIFVNIAKAQTYDPAIAETEVFKRVKPDVHSAFHIMNYQKFYKSTVEQEQLRQAFMSWQGITDLITAIINAMYTGANYDEFLVMKYLLAKHIINGRVKAIAVPAVTKANIHDVATEIKSVSNDFTFLKSKYNTAGVMNETPKNNQYLIMNSKFSAAMDIDVLANAFNMEKAEFLGHQIMVDNFGELDVERLNDLIGGDEGYTTFTAEELEMLSNVPALLVDEDFFMVYDNNIQFTEIFNGQGMYWNYFLHLWKTFSVSPFANSAVFVQGTPKVNSVVVSPRAVTAGRGQTVQFIGDVDTSNYAPQTVTWTTNSDKVVINASGTAYIDTNAVDGEVVVTATSTFDGTKVGTATLTIA